MVESETVEHTSSGVFFSAKTKKEEIGAEDRRIQDLLDPHFNLKFNSDAEDTQLNEIMNHYEKQSQSLSLSFTNATKVIRSAPWVLSYRVERSRQVLGSLAFSLGLNKTELDRCVLMYPRLLSLSVPGKLSELMALLLSAAQHDLTLNPTSTSISTSTASLVREWRGDPIRTRVRSLILQYPPLLGFSLERMQTRLGFWLRVGVGFEGLLRVLRRTPLQHDRWLQKIRLDSPAAVEVNVKTGSRSSWHTYTSSEILLDETETESLAESADSVGFSGSSVGKKREKRKKIGNMAMSLIKEWDLTELADFSSTQESKTEKAKKPKPHSTTIQLKRSKGKAEGQDLAGFGTGGVQLEGEGREKIGEDWFPLNSEALMGLLPYQETAKEFFRNNKTDKTRLQHPQSEGVRQEQRVVDNSTVSFSLYSLFQSHGSELGLNSLTLERPH